jgi:hypothetical protein
MAKRDPDLHSAWLLGKTFNGICERYDITEVAYALAWVMANAMAKVDSDQRANALNEWVDTVQQLTASIEQSR